MEMDFKVRAVEEICYICTSRENYVVVKSPEYASKEEMDYIATLYQEYEDAVYAGGVNPDTNKKYSDYIDVRSLVCYYMVNEFSKARDCFESSAYLHKEAGKDAFVMGPLWDYDMSFGKGAKEDYYTNDDPYGFSVLYTDMGKALLAIDEFYSLAKRFYEDEFAPLVQEVILGDQDAVSQDGTLHSLEYYINLVGTSAQCNTAFWYEDKSWQEETDALYEFIGDRHYVLGEYFAKLADDSFQILEHMYYDVFSRDWFYDVVTTASHNSMLRGVGDGFFDPLGTVNRAQAVQAVFNLSELQQVNYQPVYEDVVAEDWFSDAVVWAATNGYLTDFAAQNFSPFETISREQFVNLLYLFSGAPAVETNLLEGFADKDLVTAVNGVEWAVKEGILLGAEGFINPQNSITRAEMAAILVRYYNLYKA